MASERYTARKESAFGYWCVYEGIARRCRCDTKREAVLIATALNQSTAVAELVEALRESHDMLTESLRAADERFDELCEEDKQGYMEAKAHERRLSAVLKKWEQSNVQ